jgi:hypothetical protein
VGVRGSGICSQSASGIDESNEGGGGGRVCEEKGGRGGLTVFFIHSTLLCSNFQMTGCTSVHTFPDYESIRFLNLKRLIKNH